MEVLLLFQLGMAWSLLLITVSLLSICILVWLYLSKMYSLSFFKNIFSGKMVTPDVKQEEEIIVENKDKNIEIDKLKEELDETRMMFNELLFLNQGLENFHEILSKNKESLKKLCSAILNYLVDYVGAVQGAVFVQKDSQSNRLDLISGFAMPEERLKNNYFEIGEGNVGACFKDKITMEFHPLPSGYIKLGSFLGETEPNYLLLIPIKYDVKVEGVLELAFFKKIEENEKQLLEKIAENLASFITIIKSDEENEKNMKLLQEQQSELENQKSELTQNLEEMQSVQEELQRQKEELDFEKSLMDALLTNVPDYIYFKDMNSKFLKSSTSLANAFKLKSPSELVGKSDFDFFDDEHARPAYEDEQKIIKTRKPVINLVEKEVKKDGTVTYVNTTKMPLRDQKGKVIGTFGISSDITELKTMEMEVKMNNEELQAQEEELRQNLEEMQTVQEEMQRQREELDFEQSLMDALLANVPDYIYFKDLNSKFIKNSVSHAKLFGFKDPKKLVGKSDFDFFDDEHARPAYEDEQKIIKTKKPVINLVEKEVKKDGTVTYVNTSKMPLYDQNGKVMGTFGISSDITELKTMEMEIKLNNEELQAQEEELRQNLEEMQTVQEDMQRQKEELDFEKSLMDALLANVPDYIYFKDLNSKFIKNSVSHAKLFGFKDPGKLIGKSDFDFFDDEHARPAYEDEQKIIKTKRPVINLVEKEVKKDGSVSYVNTSKMPLYDQNGKVMGTFGISSDITELKTMEMEIKMNNEELQAQEEELRQNMEEMQAVQEDMYRQKEELDFEKSLMDALLANVPDFIYFKDLDSKFIKNSISHAKVFGFKDPGKLVGKSDFDFFDEEHARPAYEDEQKIIKTKKPIINMLEKEVKKDGTVSYVNTSKMPLYNREGKVIGTFGISKDITELKKLQDAANNKK